MAFNLDVKYIEEAEKELGKKLPDAYKNSMIESNGGEIEIEDEVWDLYPIFDKSDRKRIARTCNHIIKETDFYKDWNGFPENALAIASNGCGDQLILLPQDSEFSSNIYFWCHETNELTLLAKEFGEFTVL